MIRILLVTVLLLSSCGPAFQDHTSRIKRIGECTKETENWFSGSHTGKCQVLLDNGKFLSVPRPVMIGQPISYWERL